MDKMTVKIKVKFSDNLFIDCQLGLGSKPGGWMRAIWGNFDLLNLVPHWPVDEP